MDDAPKAKKKGPKPPKKPHKDDIYQTFRVWRTMPAVVKKLIRDAADAKALGKEGLSQEDLETFELASVQTKTEFAAKYGVDRDTLSRWEAKLFSEGDYMNGIRSWAQRLSTNVYMAFYKKTVRSGDAFAATQWAKIIDGWQEKTKIEHKFEPIGSVTVTPVPPRKNAAPLP